MTKERTKAFNALIALLRVDDLGVDARKTVSTTQIATISIWRSHNKPIAHSVARAEAVRLAKRITDLTQDLKTNQTQLTELVNVSPAAPLLEQPGIGPVISAICLTVWSPHGRVHPQAAFSALPGVIPTPASTGNTSRHRLNGGGDRTPNQALRIVVLNRMIHDLETRAQVEKRTAQGRTTKEIRLTLERNLARKIFRDLNS